MDAARRRHRTRPWGKNKESISTDRFQSRPVVASSRRTRVQTDLSSVRTTTRRRNGNARAGRARGWSPTREAMRRDSGRSDEGKDEKNNRTKRAARKKSQSYPSYHRDASTVLDLWGPRNQSKSINPRANQPGERSAGASPSLDARASERSTTTRERRARLSPFRRRWDDSGGIRRVGSGRERLCRDDGPGARALVRRIVRMTER